MEDVPPDLGPDTDAESVHHALVTLHARAGTYGEHEPGLVPGLRPLPTPEALTLLARSPKDEVTDSARLDLLHALAGKGFPHRETSKDEYVELARTVAQPKDLDPEALLNDLQRSASEKVPFATTDSGQKFDAHETAFIGQDVCTVRTVDVGGLKATWIFSEFETDAPFEGVADWVDPRSWPKRGPMLFKGMDLVGADTPVAIGAPPEHHWHGVFHEKVQILRELNTLLHCDHWRDGDRAAGMTYKLDLSLDSQINVDRGFLLVNDTGPVRRVKALKIVGFTDGFWTDVARYVCPVWTAWVRDAVRGGSTATPRPAPAHLPGGPPMGTADALDAWVRYFGESARPYAELFDSAVDRSLAGNYKTSDWLADGRAYWFRLAQDWARAWTLGTQAAEAVAREGLPAGLVPPPPSSTEPPPGSAPTAGPQVAPVKPTTPGAAGGTEPLTPTTGEGTTVPVPGLTADETLRCSDLVAIEAGGARIRAAQLRPTTVPLPGGAFGVRVVTTNTTADPGLYVGQLLDAQGAVRAPVQLYVSRAAEA